MLIISWNVNGLNSVLKSDNDSFLKKEEYDIFCLQEVKMQENLFSKVLFSPNVTYWNTAQKKGYSGVATIFPEDLGVVSVRNDIGEKELDAEGRVLGIEFEEFILINTYAPHSHRKLLRLDQKKRFCRKYIDLIKSYKRKSDKPIIITGDLNVAHNEIDLFNFKTNRKNAGFLKLEREWFEELLGLGFVDAYRYLNPDEKQYSWWGFAHNLRQRNIGWRLDYFLVDNSLVNEIKSCVYLDEQMGSDHCPVLLDINI